MMAKYKIEYSYSSGTGWWYLYKKTFLFWLLEYVCISVKEAEKRIEEDVEKNKSTHIPPRYYTASGLLINYGPYIDPIGNQE